MIKEFSLKRDGNIYITPHFQVREFACKDGSDKIIIYTEVVELAENARCFFNARGTVLSGYRTESYNRKVGGKSSSYHLKGMALDLRFENISPVAVALYFEYVLLKDKGGIGLYKGQNFTHIDIGDRVARWVQPGNSSTYRVVSKISLNI